ncbi:MAG TPA: VWA domain-containing protein [Pyrinomonadaceae bacterium]|jgi:Ca-activated chloride channel family protein
MKHIKLFLLAIILLTTTSINISAQADEISVETNLVTLNVSVTDKNGEYVKNLKPEDFEVLDGRTKQQIEEFSTEDAPIYFGIVYDMHPTNREQTQNVLDALKLFAAQLKQKDDYFVTVFNERGSLTTDFVPTSEQITKNIEINKPHTLYDAIAAASEKTRAHKNAKQILIVLTDGEDRASSNSLKDLRRHLRAVNLPVYTVNFSKSAERAWNYTEIYRGQEWRTLDAYETSELNKAALEEISRTTGGKSFEKMIYSRLYLYTICTKILTEVENQYVLGFYPSESDGKWHKLEVSVRNGNGKMQLSNRKGYQSPAKQ